MASDAPLIDAEGKTAGIDPDFPAVDLPILRETRSTEAHLFRAGDHATRQMYARAIRYSAVRAALQEDAALRWGTALVSKKAGRFALRDENIETRSEGALQRRSLEAPARRHRFKRLCA